MYIIDSWIVFISLNIIYFVMMNIIDNNFVEYCQFLIKIK